MFKSIYTTCMSDDGKMLKRRFENIVLKPWRFSKALSMACILTVFVAVCFFALLFADVKNDTSNENTTEKHDATTEMVEEDLYVAADYDRVAEVGVTVFCNGEALNLQNKPFYYNGDIFIPLEELFEIAGAMENFGYEVTYDGDKIKLCTNEDGLRKYEMEIGKNYIDGDNEFMPVTKPVNAPMRYNDVVYIPMEYVYSMRFYNIVIDYRLVGDNPFVQKLNDTIAFEEEARRWAPKGFTQQDLNAKAYEAYEHWDRLMEEILSAMNDRERYFTEQESWVKTREQYMENEASPYEGGSIQPLMYANAGSHITRKRCEQLLVKYAEYLEVDEEKELKALVLSEKAEILESRELNANEYDVEVVNVKFNPKIASAVATLKISSETATVNIEVLYAKLNENLGWCRVN